MQSQVDEITAGLRRYLGDRSAARHALEHAPEPGRALLGKLAELGLLGVALPERLGGVGLGLAEELAITELLSHRVAPVPILPLYVAAHILGGEGEADDAAVTSVASQLIAGAARVGAVFSVSRGVDYQIRADRASATQAQLNGEVVDVLDGGALDVLLVYADEAWWAVDADGAQVVVRESLDVTRPLASIRLVDTPARLVGKLPAPAALSLAQILLAAEAVGAAQGCLDLAVEHALNRQQFGQPIGRFQAIKQKLADCLLSIAAARSAVWGAQRSIRDGIADPRLARISKIVATQAAVIVAGEAVQIHGAIGVTWEHDLHLLMRRAKHCQLALGSPDDHLAKVADELVAESASGRRSSDVGLNAIELTREDKEFVEELRAWLDDRLTSDRLNEVRRGGLNAQRAWQAEMADGAWVGVHWPREHGGRDANFTQQVLYHSELAARGLPALIGNRGLTIVGPTLIKHGSPWQKELLAPTMRADILWSTAFSEPGSGSDLASLRTRGVIEGDELVITGQKIWTSSAHYSDWAYTLIRTGPLHPKHDGISCVVLPLKIDGLTIRPIKLNNGAHRFNELFFDGVRVPLDHVVGPLNEGWRKVNRTTMAHEHFTNFIGTHAGYANVIEQVFRRLVEREAADQSVNHDLRRRAAASWINVQLLRLNGFRNVVQIQGGRDPGPEGSIQKVMGQEEERRLFELALDVAGPAGIENSRWSRAYLSARAATIGGGTSEVHRNKLAEQVLGMPRDLWADDPAR